MAMLYRSRVGLAPQTFGVAYGFFFLLLFLCFVFGLIGAIVFWICFSPNRVHGPCNARPGEG